MEGMKYVVHGQGFLNSFTKNWWCGGDYAAIGEQIEQWLKRLLDNGASIEFVFDGSCPAEKDGDRKVRVCREVYEACAHQLDAFSEVREFAGDAVDKLDELSTHVLPAMTVSLTMRCLSSLGIPFRVADFEAHGTVVALASSLNAMVVANDSDLLIMAQIAQVGFVLLSDLLKWEPGYPLHTLQSGVLAREWRLLPQQWPLFATLCGNHYVAIQDEGYAAFLEQELMLDPSEMRSRFEHIAAFVGGTESGEAAVETFCSYFPQQDEAGIEHSVRRAYEIPHDVPTSTRAGAAAAWHSLVLDALLRRRLYLPSLCWPGSAHCTEPYGAVWRPSAVLRRVLCAILQPGETVQEGIPSSPTSFAWQPVLGAVDLPPEVNSTYAALALPHEQQLSVLLQVLTQGEAEAVQGLVALFQSKKFKKRPEALLPVLLLRYFIIQCSEGCCSEPITMVMIGAVLALAMLQPEVERSMYLKEVVGMDAMQLQCNQVFMSFLASYQGCLVVGSMLNDVCGAPVSCDARSMFDGQWLHTLLSCNQLFLTEREKKKAGVLELGFPPKIAEQTMTLFEELMNSLPDEAAKCVQGEYAGKPPNGRFKVGTSPEKKKSKDKAET